MILSIPALKWIAAALAVIAGILLVIYRSRQVRAVGSEIKSHRVDEKLELERRCPHYRDREIRIAKRTYVRPDCAQVDPANEVEFRKFASVREPIFTSVKRYIDNEHRRHLLILADSGMGKTTFCLNFFDFMRANYTNNDVALVSLARTDALRVIGNIPSKRTTTLILDALDEDPKALVSGADRLIEVMDACADFPMVIVTCRSHFFENDAAIPVRTGISQIVPRSAGRTSSYEFARLYLLPFNDDQISDFLKRSFPFLSIYSWKFRKKARELIATIPDLSARPMLLALVPELVRSGKEPRELYELYDYMVEQWLVREEKWVDPGVLLKASTEIAFHLSLTKQSTGTDRLNPNDVQKLGLTNENLEWRHLTTRSLLNRDSEGNLKFAHRSIMEFLAVKGSIAGDERATQLVWTDFMRELLLSYGSLRSDDPAGARLLDALFSCRERTLFPFADPVPQTMLRSKAEFEAFAMPSRWSGLPRHVVPTPWMKSVVQTSKRDGYLYVNDSDNGLLWRGADLHETDVQLFQIPMHDVNSEPALDGFGLPSFPEFLTLLRIHQANRHLALLDSRQFYWIGDKSDRGSKMLVSLAKTLDHPGASLICSAAKVEGAQIKLNLYAIDPYRHTVHNTTPRGLELKVKRRDPAQPELVFAN